MTPYPEDKEGSHSLTRRNPRGSSMTATAYGLTLVHRFHRPTDLAQYLDTQAGSGITQLLYIGGLEWHNLILTIKPSVLIPDCLTDDNIEEFLGQNHCVEVFISAGQDRQELQWAGSYLTSAYLDQLSNPNISAAAKEQVAILSVAGLDEETPPQHGYSIADLVEQLLASPKEYFESPSLCRFMDQSISALELQLLASTYVEATTWSYAFAGGKRVSVIELAASFTEPAEPTPPL